MTTPKPSQPSPKPGYTLTKDETARIFKVTPRTLGNWVGEGCPVDRRPPHGQLFFSEGQVRAWQAQRFDAKAALQKADLARKVTSAKSLELELTAEQGLKDLDLATRIREVKTFEDLVAIACEIAALMGDGSLSQSRGRALQAVLGEVRRSMKERRSAGGDDSEQFMLISEEGAQLLDDFEAIVSDARRADLLKHTAAQRAIDEAEHPSVDLAALLPEELEALGLEPEDDPGEVTP